MARLAVIFWCFILVACATSTSRTLLDDREVLTGDNLRSVIIGSVVTFPDGEAVTGYSCYIFARNGDAFACGRNGRADFGKTTVLVDRVCAGPDGSICWQFYRNSAGTYFIRHLAFEPNFVEEPVRLEEWVEGNASP